MATASTGATVPVPMARSRLIDDAAKTLSKRTSVTEVAAKDDDDGDDGEDDVSDMIDNGADEKSYGDSRDLFNQHQVLCTSVALFILPSFFFTLFLPIVTIQVSPVISSRSRFLIFLLFVFVSQMQDDERRASKFGSTVTALSAADGSGNSRGKHGANGGGGGGGGGGSGGGGGPPDSDDDGDSDPPDEEDHSNLHDGASSWGVRRAATDATLDMVSVPTAVQLELAEFNATVAVMKLLETLQSGSLPLLQDLDELLAMKTPAALPGATPGYASVGVNSRRSLLKPRRRPS